MSDSFNYKPIGIFHSLQQRNYDVPRQPEHPTSLAITDLNSYIELYKNHQFEQALEDLEGFTRIWVIFEFHKNHNWHPKVLPPRGSEKKVGVFSTRSPYRPNPIGLSCVETIKIEGLKIYIQPSDLLNQTPILDIKPYIPYCDAFPEAKMGWLENVDESRYQIQYSELSLKQLEYLNSHHQVELTPFIKRSLEYSPLNENTKRLILSADTKILCYRTWRIQFTVAEERKEVKIESLFSGYKENELQSSTDPYNDKQIHREFKKKFATAG